VYGQYGRCAGVTPSLASSLHCSCLSGAKRVDRQPGGCARNLIQHQAISCEERVGAAGQSILPVLGQ